MLSKKNRMRDNDTSSRLFHLVLAFFAGAFFVATTMQFRVLENGTSVIRSTEPERKIITHQTNPINYVEELMYTYKSDKSRDDHSYVKL